MKHISVIGILVFLISLNGMVSGFDCPEKDGFYPDPDDIHKFYECAGGKATEYTCANDLVFDATLIQCVNENDTSTVQTTTSTHESTTSKGAEDFNDKWLILTCDCNVATKSSISEIVSLRRALNRKFGSSSNCTKENTVKCEDYCVEDFISETNNLDLSKPPHLKTPNRSYGQIICDHINKDVQTSITLLVTYRCYGTGPDDDMQIIHDVTSKIGHEVNIKCLDGLYVN